MNSLRIYVCLLWIAGINITSYAQDTYNLEQCLEYGIRNSPVLKLDDAAKARAVIQSKKVKSAFLPSASLISEYQFYPEVPTQVIPSSALGGASDQYLPIRFGVAQNLYAGLRVNQLLFNAPLLYASKATQIVRELADIKFASSKEEVAYMISSIYYSIQITQIKTLFLDSSAVRLQAMLSAAHTLASNGLMPLNEVNRLELALYSIENERENLEILLSKLINSLKFNMGYSYEDSLMIQGFAQQEVGPLPTEFHHRLNVTALEKNISLLKIEKAGIHAGRAPTVTAFFSSGYTAFNDTFAPADKINNTWYSGTFLGLQLSLPLFDGRSRHYSAKLKSNELLEAQLELQIIRSKNELERQNALNDYIRSKNISNNALKAFQFAEGVVRSAEIELRAGLISMTDLLKILDELAVARDNYTESLIKLMLAELDVRRTTGQLLMP